MKLHFTGPATASLLIRLGLGIVFLIFGYGKFVNSVLWFGFIPPWMVDIIPIDIALFMKILGIVEGMLGILLITGLWVRVVALFVALYLLGVIIAVGYSEIAVRDFGLLLTALALAALGHAHCQYSIDGRNAESVRCKT